MAPISVCTGLKRGWTRSWTHSSKQNQVPQTSPSDGNDSILSGTQASATSSAHRLASSLLSKDNHRQARPSQTPEGSDAPSNVTCALQFDQFQR